ncbi:thioredoxin-like protein [Schizopora paradoxa]|uniref:Thioredoxin-like protein n=1 Tax=Schizopora paradoxa TaxID=27342 RepID=A0A0H2SN71_9AGAM|nr:thioredoxin-like protein [Schizopora paradoxa]
MSFRTSYICPWCYIGHLELQGALDKVGAAYPSVDFQVEYHPYSLHPSQLETLPFSKKEWLLKKLGAARYEAMSVMVNERAKAFGIQLSFEGPTCSSVQPHRVMYYAYQQHGSKVQSALVRAIYKALFEEDLDVASTPVLATLAARCGVFPNENDASAWLEGDELRESVQTMAIEAAKKINGVPLTIFAQKFCVGGSQPSACYEKVLKKLATCDFSACPSTSFPKHIAATADAPMCSPVVANGNGNKSDAESSDNESTPPASVKNAEVCDRNGVCSKQAEVAVASS